MNGERQNFRELEQKPNDKLGSLRDEMFDKLKSDGITIISGDTLSHMNRFTGNKLNIDFEKGKLIFPGDIVKLVGNELKIFRGNKEPFVVGNLKQEYISASDNNITGNIAGGVVAEETKQEEDKFSLEVENSLKEILGQKYTQELLNNIKIAFNNNGLSLKDVINVSVTSGLLFEFKDKYFNLGEIFLKSDLEKNKELANSDLLKLGFALGAIETIFDNNNHFWGSGETNAEDKFESTLYGEELKGKKIVEIQSIARENIVKLVQFRKIRDKLGLPIDERFEKTFREYENRYLEYIVGIGDKYEAGAFLFKKTETEIIYFITEEVQRQAKGGKEALFEYYKSMHSKINANFKQSDSVKESNKNFIKALNEVIYGQLLFFKENGQATDEDLLEFIKMATGRGISNDFDMEDPEFANKVVLEVMMRENGPLYRLHDSKTLKFEKTLIGDKKPDQVKNDFVKEFDRLFGAGKGEGYIKSKNLKISDLSYFDKMDVDTKLLLISLHTFTERFKEISKEDIKGKEEDWLTEIGNQITAEISQSLNNVLSEFSGLDKDSLKPLKDKDGNPLFTSTELEFMDLYYDINGAGWFNLADETNNTLSQLAAVAVPAIVGGIVLAAVAAPVVGTGLIATGVAAGVGGSIGSWVLDTRGYDTNAELVTDLSTDLLVGGATGGLGGKVLGGVKYFSDHRSIFAGIDLVVFGFAPELGRYNLIKHIFSNENGLYEENEEIDKIFLEN